MTPIPRTNEDRNALVEHTLDCWQWSAKTAGKFSVKRGNQIVSQPRSELRKRARDLVRYCLDRPVA